MASHGNDDFVYNNRTLGTLTITDATGSPVVFTVQMYTDVSVEDGGYNLVRHKDERGDFADYPPNRGEAQITKWSFKAKQIGLVGQTADATLANDLTLGDFIHQSGEYANLVSTLTGAGSRHEKTFLVTLTLTNGTGTSTKSLADATIAGKWSSGSDANTYDVTLEGQQPHTTVAFAAS